jgi:hypothetical protein
MFIMNAAVESPTRRQAHRQLYMRRIQLTYSYIISFTHNSNITQL